MRAQNEKPRQGKPGEGALSARAELGERCIRGAAGARMGSTAFDASAPPQVADRFPARVLLAFEARVLRDDAFPSSSFIRPDHKRPQDISSPPFCLGAHAEATGTDTGGLFGRLERWGVFYTEALTGTYELANRQHLGFDTSLGTSPSDPPETAPLVDVDFKDPYGTVLANDSTLTNPPVGTIAGHGTPGVALLAAGRRPRPFEEVVGWVAATSSFRKRVL